MAYDVEVAAAAERDVREYYTFLLSNSNDPIPAENWLEGLDRAIASLQQMPTRCPRIPESGDFAGILYQLRYFSHRIIFKVDKKLVYVLRVYPSSARPLTNLRQRPRHKRAPES